jgi:hypothetical protein
MFYYPYMLTKDCDAAKLTAKLQTPEYKDRGINFENVCIRIEFGVVSLNSQ